VGGTHFILAIHELYLYGINSCLIIG